MADKLLIAPEAGRFYDREGNHVYEVKKADGKGTTTPNIIHARKFGLVPSVTTVLGRIAKPGLDRWKAANYIRTAMATPRKALESEDDYIIRVAREANSVAGKAAERGTDIHFGLYEHMFDGTISDDRAIRNACEQVKAWLKEQNAEVVHLEKAMIDVDIGVAGTADLVAESPTHILYGDYKSVDLSKYKKPYYEQGLQLSAYKLMDKAEKPCKLWQIPLDRESGECQFFDWDDMAWPIEALEIGFKSVVKEWQVCNKYVPKNWKEKGGSK